MIAKLAARNAPPRVRRAQSATRRLAPTANRLPADRANTGSNTARTFVERFYSTPKIK